MRVVDNTPKLGDIKPGEIVAVRGEGKSLVSKPKRSVNVFAKITYPNGYQEEFEGHNAIQAYGFERMASLFNSPVGVDFSGDIDIDGATPVPAPSLPTARILSSVSSALLTSFIQWKANRVFANALTIGNTLYVTFSNDSQKRVLFSIPRSQLRSGTTEFPSTIPAGANVEIQWRLATDAGFTTADIPGQNTDLQRLNLLVGSRTGAAKVLRGDADGSSSARIEFFRSQVADFQNPARNADPHNARPDPTNMPPIDVTCSPHSNNQAITSDRFTYPAISGAAGEYYVWSVFYFLSNDANDGKYIGGIHANLNNTSQPSRSIAWQINLGN